jgi:hypothetical protein
MKDGNEQSTTVLQPRDRRLIDRLATLRFIDREQASILAPFHSASRAKSRLLALVRAGVLEQSLVGTVAGGRRAIYSLPGTLRRRSWARRLANLQTERFLEHRLAVNEFLLGLEYPHSGAADGSLVRWDVLTTPLSRDASIIPDGLAELATTRGRRAFFVEIDLGTESLAILEKKVSTYIRFARSGLFAERFGLPTFGVLIATTTEQRVYAIRSVIAKHTLRLFWLTDFNTIKRDGIWSSIWLRPTGEQRHSLAR